MFGFRGIFGRKPRQFDYLPRYYDIEAEAREERRKELLGENYKERYEDDHVYTPGSIVRSSMKVRRGIGTSTKMDSVKVRRLIIIFVALAAAVVWILTTI